MLAALSVPEEFIQREADIFGNLAEQYRGNVAALVAGDGCAAPFIIAKLLMGATLADFAETKFDENGDNLVRF